MKISDSELIMLIRENNEDARDILNERYTYIISLIIKKYYTKLENLNINIDELKLNCLEIINKALEDYNPALNASFNTYASLLIERKIKKTILKSFRGNKKTLEYINIDFDNAEKYHAFNEIDPLKSICLKENEDSLKKVIIEKLTNREFAIFSLMLDGLNYNEIASVLKQNYSKIYRYVKNIRRKLSPEFEKFTN